MLSALPVIVYAAEPPENTVLEFSVDSRLSAFERTSQPALYSHSLVMSIGLGWTPVSWVTVHGRVGVGWGMFVEETSYRYHNSLHETSHVGDIEVEALIDFHPGLSMLSIRGELGAGSWFTSRRGGIWNFSVGAGLGVQPFDSLDSVLRTVYFGLICRFVLYDDFGKVFSLRRRMPELGLQVSWGF